MNLKQAITFLYLTNCLIFYCICSKVWNKREIQPKKRQYKDDTADNSNPKKTRNLTDNDNNISFCEISTPLMDLVCKRIFELNNNADGLSEKIRIVDTLFNIYSMIYINKYNKEELEKMYKRHENDEYRYFIF